MYSCIFETYNNSMIPYCSHVPTHFQNMHYYKVNLCCVAIKDFHLLLYPVKNQIGTAQAHVLQYTLMFK